MSDSNTSRPPLTPDDVRKVARLARLSLTDEQVNAYRTQLAGVLALMDKLSEVDVSGVEPMSHPSEAVNRLAEDAPSAGAPMLPTSALLGIAPETMDQFVKIPKVIGEGGGA